MFCNDDLPGNLDHCPRLNDGAHFVADEVVEASARAQRLQEQQLRDMNRIVGAGAATPAQLEKYVALLERTVNAQRSSLASSADRLVQLVHLLASRDRVERDLRAEIARLKASKELIQTPHDHDRHSDRHSSRDEKARKQTPRRAWH